MGFGIEGGLEFDTIARGCYGEMIALMVRFSAICLGVSA